MAMSTSATPRIRRFDGSNFLAWRNRVYTELLCDDLTELVDKKPTDEQRKKTFGNEKKPWSWTQADARARRVIIEHLDDTMLHYAPTDLTAYEIWRRLKVTYNRTSYLQHAYLRRKLSNLQFDGRTDLSAFLKEFDDVIGEIRAGGGKVGKFEDLEAVVTLLAALPSSFSPVIASLGEINDSSPVTLEMLKGILLDYDLKRSDESKPKRGVEGAERTAAAYVSDTGGEASYASDKRSSHNKRNEPRGEKSHCSYCNREGHIESRCFQKRREQRKTGGEANLGEGGNPKPSSSPRAISFLAECEDEANLGDTENCKVTFCGDSGCTRFMTGDRCNLQSCVKLDNPVPVTLANDTKTEATHLGVMVLLSNKGRKLVLTDVLLVPGVRRNLLSIRRIAKKGYDVVFRGDSDTVEISKNGEIIADGYVINDLYFFEFSVVRDDEANLAASSVSYIQAHRRLGHVGRDTLVKMRQKGIVDFCGNDSEVCEPCIRGKLCQLPYPPSTFRTTRPLQQIVSDVCEATITSHDGYKFFVTFLDVHTHFSVVYMLRHKSEVFDRFVDYEAMARAQFGFGIGSFLCDNGREFINQDVSDFCRKKGIRMINSVAYNHQQNGRAERLNRTLEDRSRTMLMETEMPKSFWSEAILCATYCLNRALTKANDKIPAIEWYKNEVHFHKLRPFGCICYTHVPKEKRKKFDARAEKGIMVGYAPLGYRILDLATRKIVAARNVFFDETKFFKDLQPDNSGRRAESAESSDDELEERVEKQGDDGIQGAGINDTPPAVRSRVRKP